MLARACACMLLARTDLESEVFPNALGWKMTAVGFEPAQLALVELESTPLDHSGKLSWQHDTHMQ